MIQGSRSESTLCASASCAASLINEAHQILASSGYPALRLLRCEYEEGAVVIYGVVSSYYQKQLAQAILLTNPRIPALVNRTEVFQKSSRERAALPEV